MKNALIEQAYLIVSNHHDMGADTIGEEFRGVRDTALRLHGYHKFNDSNWTDLIEGDEISEDLRVALIAMDDCLATHCPA